METLRLRKAHSFRFGFDVFFPPLGSVFFFVALESCFVPSRLAAGYNSIYFYKNSLRLDFPSSLLSLCVLFSLRPLFGNNVEQQAE